MTVVELLGTLVDKSIVTVSFPSADARYDLLDTVRDYALERLAEGGGLVAARKAHAEYFATLADAAHGALRGPEWRAWVGRLELERDNLWAALTYAHEASDAGIAGRLGTLAWYFTLAERVSEGRRFVELALAAASEDAPAPLRLELEAFLCFFATEELDLDTAIEIGERALVATEPLPPQSALVEAALALALAESGDGERAAVLAEQAHARLQPTGDDWSIAATSLLRAQVAALAGDVSTVAAMAAQAHRHAGAIGFDAFQVPALLLEAWVAERRSDESAAAEAYQRAFALAGRCRVCRPRSLRAGRARLGRVCERRPPQGRRARAPGARRRGGGTVAVGRGARARPAGPRAGRRGRRRQRRGAVPRACSSGPTSSDRTKHARACSWRSPKTRARPPGPVSTTSGSPERRAAVSTGAETALTP